MEQRPVAGLDDLERHLEQVAQAPDTPLDSKLFDDVELQLTEHNIPLLIPRLLPKLTEILSKYQKDPAHLVSLSIKLLGPVPFTETLALASEDALIRALQSPAPSANILALTVLHKAAKRPSDTAILSGMKAVVEQFMQTWLSSPSVEVGEKATKSFGDLLEIDCDHRPTESLASNMSGLEITSRTLLGQGLLWRRIFQDKDIYASIFSLCHHQTTGNGPGRLDERQKTLAQARLMRVLPRLAALDFKSVTRSHFPDVESQYGLDEGAQGLLYFAAVKMVNKEDVLMHVTLIDFIAELLEAISMTDITRPTFAYLAKLLKAVTAADASMYKSLESLALSPSCPPELVDLLVKLEEHP